MSYGSFEPGKKTLLFFCAVLLFAVVAPLSAQDADLIPVPIFIDGIYSGEVSITILPDESVQIRPSELIALLEELMSDESIDTAEKIFPASGWLDLTGMGGLGVRILFKFEDLTLHITIPPHLRRETVISLTSPGRQPEGEEVYPADFSLFMNLRLWNRFTYENLLYEFSAAPELGMNIFGWVVEAEGGVQTFGDIFFLDYARLVKDFSAIGYRLEVGDLTLPVQNLSGISYLTGVSFRKKSGISASSALVAGANKEIFLREPSKVQIFINDRKIREANYPSGSYVFTDFYLSRGTNRVIIRWEDSEGVHEEELVIPYDSKLLSPGDFDLGGGAGIPDRTLKLPALSAYEYLGVTDSFTFGLSESFNFDKLELNLKPELLLSTGFGSFRLVPEWGMRLSGEQMLDIDLGYQLLNPGLEQYLNFGGEISFLYDGFAAADPPPMQLSAEGYYNFIFGDGFSLTPEVFWGYRFDEQRQIIKARAIFKKTIRGGSAITANIGFSYDLEPSFSATISYSSSFPDLDQNIYILENLATQKLSAFWNKYSTDENNFALSASTEIPMSLDEKLSLGGYGSFTHPLFSVSASHDFDAIISASEYHNATTVSASTAFVFAGDSFLLTRPVNDSFIIVAPDEEFADQKLLVNPYSGGSDLELSGGPGVLSNVNAFSTHKVYIEAEELIPGMDDSGLRYLAKPEYKSGIVITPHAEKLIYIGGIITDSEGVPVEAALGSLTGKSGEERIDFFTDENGYFEAYNLSDGLYSLRVSGYDGAVDIDLTGVESGFHEAGRITIGEDE